MDRTQWEKYLYHLDLQIRPTALEQILDGIMPKENIRNNIFPFGIRPL
jgi:hypothetical protein